MTWSTNFYPQKGATFTDALLRLYLRMNLGGWSARYLMQRAIREGINLEAENVIVTMMWLLKLVQSMDGFYDFYKWNGGKFAKTMLIMIKMKMWYIFRDI